MTPPQSGAQPADQESLSGQRGCTRRDVLRLGTGSLLALGFWPGWAQARDKEYGSFKFLVVNDTHYMTPECGKWLEAALVQMKSQAGVEFCLLVGDLVEKGERDHLAAVRDIFRGLGVPVYTQIGNHDYLTQTDRRAYDELFPGRLNYSFRAHGWQFVGLDTSDGVRYQDTYIQPPTFDWLDRHLARLDRDRPTVLFTHFPVGAGVRYRPHNAELLLEYFKPLNLRAIFSGHFHGLTERKIGRFIATTNRCCALKRGNHDGTRQKGFFVCSAEQGQITRVFVEVPMP